MKIILFLRSSSLKKDLIESNTKGICDWLSYRNKVEEKDLLELIKDKKIKGKDIGLIIDAFIPIIYELKKKEIEKNNPKELEKRLPPGWMVAVSPSGETFFLNTKTGLTLLEAPEMCVSDLPFSDSKEKPSALETFQRTKPDFYKSLEDAFEPFKTVSFKDNDEFKKKSQEIMAKLDKNFINEHGIIKEDVDVLLSYSYEVSGGKDVPYRIINKILAARNDNGARAYGGYILHLLKALRKLKPYKANGTTLYRGIEGKFLKFDDEHYKVGNTMTWPAFTSTTKNDKVIYTEFLKRTTQPVIFEIHGDFVGYDIEQFSNFTNEKEVLLEPETKFEVISIQDDAKNPNAKRIVVKIKKTQPMIKEVVENFEKTEKDHLNNRLNWTQRTDPTTGRIYYENTKVKITRWDLPTFN